MEFEFNNQYIAQSLLSIEQIGDCAIEGENEQGYFYYIVIKTSLGTTSIYECGPVVPDVVLLPNGYKTSLTRINYDENKLKLYISKWLNDKKSLTSARIIDKEDAISQFRELKEYIQNYSDEVY